MNSRRRIPSPHLEHHLAAEVPALADAVRFGRLLKLVELDLGRLDRALANNSATRSIAARVRGTGGRRP